LRRDAKAPEILDERASNIEPEPTSKNELVHQRLGWLVPE
jgi:hypothetical protein